MRGLSPVAASGGHSSSRCAGLSLLWPLLLRSTGFRRAGSATVAHGPSCSAACGILPDQGSNPCPLHRQADSQPLRHQGSPNLYLLWIACVWVLLFIQLDRLWVSNRIFTFKVMIDMAVFKPLILLLVFHLFIQFFCFSIAPCLPSFGLIKYFLISHFTLFLSYILKRYF